MTKKIFNSSMFILCSSLIFVFTSNAQILSGVSTIQLTSPVTPELKKKQRAKALDSLANYCKFWVNDFFGNRFDLTNPVSEHFINIFATSCQKMAKEESILTGREWTIEFTIPYHIVDSIISSYNTRFDTQALHYWNMVAEAQKYNSNAVVFKSGLNALFYSMAHIGSPIEVPEMSSGTILTDYLRTILQKLIHRIDITLSNPVIKGKPPNLTKNIVNVKVNIDTVPFINLPLIARLPDGRKILSMKTGDDGSASPSNFKIPFVAHGTLLHIQPDFGAIIDVPLFLEAKSLGLQLTENIDQTLIFSIIKPVYTLEYKAHSVNQMEIPSLFSNNAFIHSFLTDSCPLQPSGGGKPTDLAIKINCQISNYTFDELEEVQVKVESNIVINELKPNGSKAEHAGVLHKRKYDVSQKIPVGLFFWESSNALRDLIRRTLDKL